MDAGDWALIWLVLAGVFVVGEMISPGFYLLPFAVSAAVALVLSALGVPVPIQWIVFIAGGAALFWVALKYIRKHDDDVPLPKGVGVTRLLDEIGPVVETVPAGPTAAGRVKLGAEIWVAESANDTELPQGTIVRVAEVKGTRVIVVPADVEQGSS